MELLRNLVKGTQEGKDSPNKPAQANKSVVVTPNVETRRFSKFAKEDPGPRKDRFVSYKKAIVKNVADNKRRVDERGKFFSPSKAESVFKDREEGDVGYFDLNPEDLFELSKAADKTKDNYSIIKQTALYLHTKGATLQRLQEKEQLLKFPVRVDTKQESELVDYLTKALERQTVETKKLQEEIQMLTKVKNKAEEDLSKVAVEVDAKSKKIAELNYTIRVGGIKMQECQKKAQQQVRSIEELKRMQNHEQMKYMQDIISFKKEQSNLLRTIDEKEVEIKRLRRENEELRKENPLATEEQKLLSKSFHKLNETIPAIVETRANFHSIVECSNVIRQ
eukprot:TRINITY_DN10646_c0_g1_i2.p1 TRINITY_DN10646_c0_g1~~TRINITY_DN10646_c0_g1_i2.p1  ORF type:complete len:336 (+),score=129.42 TRINITY_DN10646_c0_g1_i2:58-1065(+)